MKKLFFSVGCLILVAGLSAQSPGLRLQKAFVDFEADIQLKHAVSSLYVIDAKTGQLVFGKNQQIGLAPASTQKIITSVTAFELLGKGYRYKTELGYSGKIADSVLSGTVYLLGSGDPTLGSWRWNTTKDTALLRKWAMDIRKAGIKAIDGSILFDWSRFSSQTIPDGWIWEDIGNYYGAGAESLNWKENQRDILLQSGGQPGSPVKIITGKNDFINELKAGPAGSGDNAYAYLKTGIKLPVLKGTIPVNESSFKISVADADPAGSLLMDLGWYLSANGIRTSPEESHYSGLMNLKFDKKYQIISTVYSPPLDSIIYWFNKKSINLYGEALIKTFAFEKYRYGSTDSGTAIVRNFWKQKGLDPDELNIYDGSGLSPLNRITTHAQVEILKYAKSKAWYSSFYNALPEYNGIKMKSGTIGGVKGFCGYHKAKDGREYIFSFLVNNYSGSSSVLVGKMYKVLDLLK